MFKYTLYNNQRQAENSRSVFDVLTIFLRSLRMRFGNQEIPAFYQYSKINPSTNHFLKNAKRICSVNNEGKDFSVLYQLEDKRFIMHTFSSNPLVVQKLSTVSLSEIESTFGLIAVAKCYSLGVGASTVNMN